MNTTNSPEGHRIYVHRPSPPFATGPGVWFGPVVTEDGVVVVAGDGPVWCDPRESVYRDPDVVIDQSQGGVDDIDWNACGTHVKPRTVRPAWADDVAPLDIEEPIWLLSSPDPPVWRERFGLGSCNHSSYWVGIGPCLDCDGGLMVVCLPSNEDPRVLRYVCHLCRRYWIDRTRLEVEPHGDYGVGPLAIASADDVVTHRQAPMQSKDGTKPTGFGRRMSWTLRPRNIIENR